MNSDNLHECNSQALYLVAQIDLHDRVQCTGTVDGACCDASGSVVIEDDRGIRDYFCPYHAAVHGYCGYCGNDLVSDPPVNGRCNGCNLAVPIYD